MEDQLLETYKYAAEEMRSLREHEWTVTNYTVIAYGALAGIPWVASKALPNAERWRTSVSVFAVVVVLFVEYQALRTLWFTGERHYIAAATLIEAVESLEAVCKIHRAHPPMRPSERPWWVRLPSFWSDEDRRDLRCETPSTSTPRPGADRESEEGGVDAPGAGQASLVTVSAPSLRPGLVAVVVFGAMLAGLIIVANLRGSWLKLMLVALGAMQMLVAAHAAAATAGQAAAAVYGAARVTDHQIADRRMRRADRCLLKLRD